MWALSDRLVGSMGFFRDSSPSNVSAPYFAEITTEVQQTSILGSSDLDVFFDVNHNVNHPKDCRPSPQRQAGYQPGPEPDSRVSHRGARLQRYDELHE
jgi:hypothetical protein